MSQCDTAILSPGEFSRLVNRCKTLVSDRAPGKYLTELWAAERLVRDHGVDLRYTDAFGWMNYVNGVWKNDNTGEIYRRAKKVVRSLYAEAEKVDDDVVRKGIVDFAKSCEAVKKLKAIVEHAKTEPSIAIDPTVFDADPMILNCKNGIVDLRTGTLRPHSREDYCTKQAGTDYDQDYDADKSCPKYSEFIKQIFSNNKDMINFTDRKLGYNLTGQVTEKQFDIWHGADGDNGKTTLTELIFSIMGDYAARCPTKVLCLKQNDGHATDRMTFRGARFVSSAESGESVTLDEEFIKSMTGGDRVTARLCHRDNVSFPPTWKLQMFTNHRPKIVGTDDAIWKRVHLWPFLERFIEPADPQNPQPGEKDKYILDKLRSEHPSILARWVRGCLAWQKEGLKPPAIVISTTKEYRKESDMLGGFIEECCETQEGFEVAGGVFYGTYQIWARENGYKPLGNWKFSERIVERDGIDHVKGRNRLYTGITVIPEWRTKYDAMEARKNGSAS